MGTWLVFRPFLANQWTLSLTTSNFWNLRCKEVIFIKALLILFLNLEKYQLLSHLPSRKNMANLHWHCWLHSMVGHAQLLWQLAYDGPTWHETSQRWRTFSFSCLIERLMSPDSDLLWLVLWLSGSYIQIPVPLPRHVVRYLIYAKFKHRIETRCQLISFLHISCVLILFYFLQSKQRAFLCRETEIESWVSPVVGQNLVSRLLTNPVYK